MAANVIIRGITRISSDFLIEILLMYDIDNKFREAAMLRFNYKCQLVF